MRNSKAIISLCIGMFPILVIVSTPLHASTSELNGTIEDGSSFNAGTNQKIPPTCKLVNKSDGFNLYDGAKLIIERGSNSSSEADTSTGTLHNHGTLTIYKGSHVEGEGQITLYIGFTQDEPNTELAGKNYEEGGYKKDGYNAETHLDDNEKLRKATYYDLTNNTPAINEFRIYRGAKVVGTNVDFGTELTPENSRVITDSNRGDGGDNYGFIKPEVTIGISDSPLYQSATTAEKAYNLASAAKALGRYESEHSSNTKDEIPGAFFSADGYVPYNEEEGAPEGASTFKFNLKNTGSEDAPVYSYTPVYIPKVDDNVVISKTVESEEVATEYENYVREKLEQNKFDFAAWEGSDPVTVYSGDNSWFNGVYQLKRGAMVVPYDGGMFGGRVEIGEVSSDYASAKGFHEALAADDETAKAYAQNAKPTEFEWEGGAKDEYNKPDIYMNGNSTLYFNLKEERSGETPIFSFYGSLHGSETDRIIFENGEVRIKGDCSGFRGKTAVAQGAKFVVRSSDSTSSSTYSGKFPNAYIYQVDADGNLVTTTDNPTEIDSPGLENVTVNNGYIKMSNSDGGTIALKSSNVTRDAMVELNGTSEIKDVTIKGLVVSKGDLTAKNLTLNGGIFAVEGSITTENLTAGSTIALWGNDKIDRSVSVGGSGSGATFEITDNHTLKLFSDFQFSDSTTDQINVLDNTVVHAGNGVEIAGMNFIDTPTADEYLFQVLTGTGMQNVPVSIGGGYGDTTVFDVYLGGKITATGAEKTDSSGGSAITTGDSKMTYSASRGTKLLSSISNGIGQFILNGTTYYVQGTKTGGYVIISRVIGGSAGATQTMHLSGLDNVSSIFNLVSGTGGIDPAYWDSKLEMGKYEIWNRSFAEFSKYETSSTADVKSNNKGAIFGLDAKPIAMSEQMYFMPTIFAGIVSNDMKFNYFKSEQTGYVAGLKQAFFGTNSFIEFFETYEFLSTRAKRSKTKIKSHVFGAGSKAGYNLRFGQGWALTPSILMDYYFVKTPKFNAGTVIGDVKTKALHRCDIVPELSISKKLYEQWSVGMFGSYHQNLGRRARVESNLVHSKSPDITKRRYIEYGLSLNYKNANDSRRMGFKISQKVKGAKGVKASVSVGIRF